MKASLAEIADLIKGEVVGNEDLMVSSISPIDNIEKGALVFADGKDNLKRAENSEAAAILVDPSTQSDKKTLIQVSQPLRAFITLLNHYNPPPQLPASIHPTAVIAEDAQIGKEVFIGPYAVIESGSVIGDHCVLRSHVHIGRNVILGSHTVLHPHVTVYDDCNIGSRVHIHASTVIGADGFGYTFTDGKHLKVPHIGHVNIEDDVEIGSNSVVDRATLGATVIGAGTKIDNHVQVAHSVKLGKHNILCAFTGIAGSSVSGDRVIFAANVGVSDHVRIDDDVILGARAGVPPKKHLLEGNVYLGNPARPRDKAVEQELSVSRIPIMRKNYNQLKETVKKLAERLEKLEAEK
ncbi:UDP-3-O-(3-hydroxymyristoyl)glucosamine N-acyltransferase [Legionella israelensis]|uniref:UDP-3-O-acylglucosamine N-acyltransferase n=1 Tax=Legionella israelensis TaxID=454 RepID=A0A0W0VQI8_9GAMM|nr:UDP-3-O-(3-hydroxymyristoyl)glucosamine N-acyltransferase [Legionella israelensis]KTD22480.1 UDP-3-O-(R-3-hydroxymyristoyl)-glucosamine N-acyltransferase [Legionella israelensis]QBR83079.1 UDP-3-O-(3-hydroxymyristoyl)glucosamine N-acyltransferase [Legionella israelensis]QBS09559.1 UDP-3-O-(3-hydroxymyristoyl)glucosamine N-acyltransferase [Legionella israelensis]QDP71608.1 UDP-3-O-(3-hydroxymyristoyl)glucosamine N-acyltransferase [Legionella israelensis]SCY17173.1 UDP-3-O-[3-hydroxymyristoyl